MWHLVLIIPIIIVLLGILNHLKAMVKTMKDVDPYSNYPSTVFIYFLMQTVMTILYLTPFVLLAGFCHFMFTNPTAFVNNKWTYIATGIYALILGGMVALGVVLLVKRHKLYIPMADDIYLYVVRHRVIISFVCIALSVASLVMCYINLGKYNYKQVSSIEEVSAQLQNEYCALDLSALGKKINGCTLKTEPECEILTVKGDKGDYQRLTVVTNAQSVNFYDLDVSNMDLTLKQNATVKFENCNLGGKFSFNGGNVEVVESTVNGSVTFSSDTTLLIEDSKFFANTTFDADSQVNLVGESKINGQITYGADAKETTLSNKEGSVAVKEIPHEIDLSFEPRNQAFTLNLEDINLCFKNAINLSSSRSLNINNLGGKSDLRATNGNATITADRVNFNVEGELNVIAPTYGLDCIVANTVRFGGSGNSLICANSAKLDGVGGCAVRASVMACNDSISLILCGGNGYVGKTGEEGKNGANGKKGNNESQGKDTYYGYDGRPGAKGEDGKTGYQGGMGGTALCLENSPNVSKQCNVTLLGGYGGKGGKGGNGGNGGRGGDGGDDDKSNFLGIGDMSGGRGGYGGLGGNGGSGGKGGKGGCSLTVNGKEVDLKLSNVNQINGKVGELGESGKQGQKGANGAHGNDR